MAKTLEDMLFELPSERQAGIAARTLELATLGDLRQAAELTQCDLAATLNVGQEAISHLEKRNDMLLSTLRHYVEGMGGQLDLVVRFPGRPPVSLKHFGG
ncbi:MAG: helix-turn-helix domain-containing protein [Betaproteobacteria bacterium]|nr:helix-turn-helix domain-containing protein [Betaproteobacteria bacterium]